MPAEHAWHAVEQGGSSARRVPDRPTTRSEEARIILPCPLCQKLKPHMLTTSHLEKALGDGHQHLFKGRPGQAGRTE